MASDWRGLPRKEVTHTWLTVWVLHFKSKGSSLANGAYTSESKHVDTDTVFTYTVQPHAHSLCQLLDWVLLAVKAALWVCWHNIQVAALKHDSRDPTMVNKSLSWPRQPVALDLLLLTRLTFFKAVSSPFKLLLCRKSCTECVVWVCYWSVSQSKPTLVWLS